MGLKDQVLARQLMARHLYVLARLMIDDAALTNVNWFTESGLSLAQKKELAIRRIAQWAINVVDNACPDNIMTPFEYDLYPFDAKDPTTSTPKDPAHTDRTWCVDGIIDDGNGNLSADDNKPWRGLVWGCKSPALLITETLAFHDRRVADTPTGHTREDTAPNNDLDLDQVRIPEGSLFVELFATHNQNNPQQSGDLYTYQSNAVTGKSEWVLDLSKMAPAGSDGNTANIAYPVWRLAISAPQVGTPAAPHATLSFSPGGLPNNSPGYLATFPDSASLDLQQYTVDTNHGITTPDTNNGSLLKSPSQSFDMQLERIVWFSGTAPTTQLGNGGNYTDIFYARQYFNKYYNGKAYVSPGGYAVVGPREVTAIGSYPSTALQGGQKWGYPSPQRINLNFENGTSGGISDATTTVTQNYPQVGTQILAPVGIVAAAAPPATWVNAAATAKLGADVPSTGIGLNISEPLPQSGSYYPEPAHANPNSETPGYARTDAYDDLTAGGSNFRDTPLELSSANTNYAGKPTHLPVELLPTQTKTATTFDYRTVFLQRLANPLAPYHPKTNPYLTVDWMPVDLTVFNGEDALRSAPANPPSPWDPDDPNNSNGDQTKTVAFASRQRGEYSTHTSGVCTKQNIWSIWPDATVAAGSVDGGSNLLFNLGGENPQYSANEPTLSGLNFQHLLYSQAGPTIVKQNRTTLGYLNFSYGDPWSQAGYIGSPSVTDATGVGPRPFPWLTWNNRPYANPSEVLFVPATHPGRVSIEFGLTDSSHNVYDPTNTANQRAPFSHLINFFNGSLNGATNSLNMAGILDYLQTASPFVGTETVLNPSTFYWGVPASGAEVGEGKDGSSPEPYGTAGLHPPFNFVSNYRDPGRVNINTISSDSVWRSIVGGDPNSNNTVLGPKFSDVQTSRQGYDGSPYVSDGQHPSIFSNPFRSAADADMEPLAGLAEKPVNATLWRAKGTKGGATNIDATDTPLLLNRLMGTSQSDYNDWRRNAYFAYQPFGNIVNKVTTRSNVYAVWITVGYFEVTPWYGASGGVPNPSGTITIDAAHPDGYQLGQELGADTGEITRHRGFYIIDRSIPVGFQRGSDLNSDKAVILKRFIE